jgi:hypothetical protein
MATISGKVTLLSTPIQGALVYLIKQSTDTVIDTTTTDVNGDYSFTVDAATEYHLTIEYNDGSEDYTAKSLWDVVGG